MKWRSRRVSLGALLLLAGLGIGAMLLVEFSRVLVKRDYFYEKVEASKLALKAAQTLRSSAGVKIILDAVTDPNGTGLIGEQFTAITTDQGNLTAKLTSTNPNFAAVIVEMLRQAGVERGEPVAVSYTGSIPGLNISVLAALQIIGARPVIVSSIGSSMWGANNPAFSWLDMEKLLFDKGIFRYKSVAVSLGGRTDRGGNVSPEGRQIMRDIIARNGVPLIEEQTLDEAIRERMKIFEENLKPGEKFAAYINVGGGLASLGSAQNLVMIESGLNLTLAPGNYPLKGTMILMGEKDVPMINLSDVDVLARRYGLPVAPEPIPDIPHGDIYFKEKYRLAVVIPTLIIYVIIVFIFIRIDVMANLFNKNRG